MKHILNHLFAHKALSKEEAREVLSNIAKGNYNPSQVASFLTVYIMRSITVDELEGFRDAMLELCVAVDLEAYDPIDLCGTGGDGKDTFNVSTLASFVTAGAGVKVAKHGNYGVSSVSGSSNVIEYFGYRFTNDAEHHRKKIEEAGICFLHAPLFHPAMKNVAPIRRELGVKTFFNMLGPMVNPAFPKKQLVGVFSLELARLYQYLYQKTDKRFMIIHGLDGYDEMSLTSDCKVASDQGESLINAHSMGMKSVRQEDLFGGKSVEDAALIFKDILENKGTRAQQDVVIANAALAISCARPQLGLEDSVAAAKESLISGQALRSFTTFIAN